MKDHSMVEKYFDALGDEPLSLLLRARITLHLLFCPRCAGELKRWGEARRIMKAGFFPPSPGLEDAVMERVFAEAAEDVGEPSPGVSFPSWVITGFIVLISLSTSFFGMDFIDVAAAQGSSFLIPLGLTVGCVLTGYGALFIGSHLKELSERFGL